MNDLQTIPENILSKFIEIADFFLTYENASIESLCLGSKHSLLDCRSETHF